MRGLSVVTVAIALILSGCGGGGGSSSATVASPSTGVSTGALISAGPEAKATARPTPTAADAGWIMLEGEGFSAKFPAQPALTHPTTPTTAGDAPTSFWVFTNDLVALYVARAEMPPAALKGVSIGDFYKAELGKLKNWNGGTQIYPTHSDVTLNGHPGTTFDVMWTSSSHWPPTFGKGMLFLVGNVYYQVYAEYSIVPGDKNLNVPPNPASVKLAELFLSKFELAA